jgi:hypothetical protein
MFAWLISHKPAVLFSQNKPATSNQPAVLFSQNKSAPAISHNAAALTYYSSICNGGLRLTDQQRVRLAYQPPASSTFLSEQTSHQQPASNTFLSE